MQRCLDLARQGAGFVAPNPLVGAVLVYQDRIIGEGLHEQYGAAHAEVNCINSVAAADRQLIPHSTLYVSLEPCAHFGKTPPCADRIIREGISRVVIACRDPFPAVNGKGIEKLIAAGVQVSTGILEKQATIQNARFFCFHTLQRPYIILKWAASADGYIAGAEGKPTAISNSFTNRLVHRWRMEEAAILIGKNTALTDDPLLTNRYWEGPSPLRLVIDRHQELPEHLRLFQSGKTIWFNENAAAQKGDTTLVQLEKGKDSIQQVLGYARQNGIQSILVEGGRKILQSFINAGLWDEIRCITNRDLKLHQGIAAPQIPQLNPFQTEQLASDQIQYFRHPHS